MTRIKEVLTKVSDSTKRISSSKKQKKIILAVFASLVIVAAIIGIAAGVNSKNNNSDEADTSHHPIVKSACSITRFPEFCFSEVTKVGTPKKKVTSQKDVIELSLNITVNAVEHNFFKIKKLLNRKGLTEREKTALHDCLETIDETLDELHQAVEDLHEYPNKKTLVQHADDLKTLMSAAMTNQETCLDGFSHDDADKKIRKVLISGEKYVEKMCSNALAMIKNMTDTDVANDKTLTNRKLKEEENDIAWPEWLSAGDRRLLQSSTVTPDVVVAADGSGDFKTVSEAVAKAPEKSSKRYVIRIKAGVYKENVEVPKKKTNIMFVGDGRTTTIITGSRNVVDGSTTFHSATVGKSIF
ncbi:Pectinesterase, catalytic [Corchorus capsularis]|uniref:Pectinesterase n=1 Tax=Corchorus capsularis TaxID=210143 RepID=A0A1R3HJL2_COCAP|nr:Pectinesterase, catalytic [Corchorus capsularis]